MQGLWSETVVRPDYPKAQGGTKTQSNTLFRDGTVQLKSRLFPFFLKDLKVLREHQCQNSHYSWLVLVWFHSPSTLLCSIERKNLTFYEKEFKNGKTS